MRKFLNKMRNKNDIRVGMGYTNLGKGAQMLMIAGITLVIMILIIASIAVKLSTSGVEIPLKRGGTIFSEYGMLREKFGIALGDNVRSLTASEIREAVNKTRDMFRSVELKHGNIFNAELEDITTDYLGYTHVMINITLISEDSKITEVVDYTL